MTVSSGFFNSVNHDRLYDATQLSSIFDGIIKDGVYQGVGKALRVSAKTDSNNTVIIGSGRAWFDHTWTLNDSDYALVLDSPNEFLGRIDAIVLDVNREENTRKNEIKYLIGSFSSSPQKPELIKSTLHNQYPLAYITIKPGSDAPISDANIEICVGTDACPLVTGLLEVINSDVFMQQVKGEFNDWFDGIKDLIDENTALKLQNQIDEINNKITNSPIVGVSKEAYNFARNYHVEYICRYGGDSSAAGFSESSEVLILPDGYFLEICILKTANDTSRNKGRYLCARIYDRNLTIVSTTNITTTTSTPLGNQLTEQAPKMIWNNCDSYPCTGVFAVDNSTFTSSGYTKHALILCSVSVSANHVVSSTITKTSSINTVYTLGSNFDSNTGVTFPAYMSDGSVFVATYGAGYVSPSNQYVVGFFRFDKSLVVSNSKAFNFSHSGSTFYEINLCATKTGQYIDVGFSSTGNGTVIQVSTLTDLGKSQFPIEPNPENIVPDPNVDGYCSYANLFTQKKMYFQNSESYNISTSERNLSSLLKTDNEIGYGDPFSSSFKAITPDGKFLIYGAQTKSTEEYGYKYIYLVYNGDKDNFSVMSDRSDGEIGNYSTETVFYCVHKPYLYYDELEDSYTYLFYRHTSINVTLESDCLAVRTSGGPYLFKITRKES